MERKELIKRIGWNIAYDLKNDSTLVYDEYIEELEVNYADNLDNTEEYIVNFGDELLFDGLTENEAYWIREAILTVVEYELNN